MISAADINTAIINRWNVGSLDTPIPGSIHAGRLTATNEDSTTPRPMPYAMVETKKSAGDVFYSGGIYITAFVSTIAIYGVGQQAVDLLGKTVAASLSLDDWVVPGTGNRLLSTFYSPENGTLEQPESRREGEDVWIMKIVLDVMAEGPE